MSSVIALFGASGKTGREFLALALQRGHRVRALVRRPDQFSVQHPNLTVVPGDVLSAESVARVVAGADAAVSVFGHVKGSPPRVQTEGTRHIVAAMRAHGVRRLVSLSGGGLPFEKDRPKLADKLIRLIMKVAVPNVLQDAIEHAQVLQASGLDWTIVRGPRLTTQPATG